MLWMSLSANAGDTLSFVYLFAAVFAVCMLYLCSKILGVVREINAGRTQPVSGQDTSPAPVAVPAAVSVSAPAAVAVPAVPAMVPAPGSLGELAVHGNIDDKTIAMVMAIVADDLKAPLNVLRFISIKEV